MSKIVACLGDPSSHGGSLVSSNQDGRLKLMNIEVCANGCMHACPIPGHGVTPVIAVTVKSYVNGNLIVTEGAMAGCGAIIIPPDRRMTVE